MIIQDMESDVSGSSIFKMNHLVYGEFYCYTRIFQEILQRFKLMTLKHEKVLITYISLFEKSVFIISIYHVHVMYFRYPEPKRYSYEKHLSGTSRIERMSFCKAFSSETNPYRMPSGSVISPLTI